VNAMNVHWVRRGEGANRPPFLGGLAPDVLICGEPIGIESSVAQTNNPDDFEAMWRAAESAQYDLFVFHTDAGTWCTFITERYKASHGNGFWRVISDHTSGREVMARLRALRGGTGGSGGGWSGVPSGVGAMRIGQRLLPGQRLTAPDNSHFLEYQADANIVIRRADGHPIWASNASHAPGYVEMQTDGHFVEYDASGRPRRGTHTWGQGGAAIQLQTDGNLVMYRADGTPIWASFSSDIFDENGEPVR
jgi:hypothetical protein